MLFTQDSLCQQELDDFTLLKQANAGDQQACETLILRYQHQLFLFIKKHLGNDETHDVLQRVWLQLYTSLPKLQDEAMNKKCNHSLRPWLFRVARNQCVDEYRRNKRLPLTFSAVEASPSGSEENSAILSIFDPAPQPEAVAEHDDQLRRIYAAILSLQTGLRLVVWLRFTRNLTFQEIGQSLQMPTNTVKTYFYRGCEKLRTLLAEEYKYRKV